MSCCGVPEDQVSVFVNPRRSLLSLTAPLGRGRFCAYVSVHKDARESAVRPLSGQAGIADFVAASVAARAPAAAVRETALAKVDADRSRGLDIIGLGPDFPCDEATRRRFFGED